MYNVQQEVPTLTVKVIHVFPGDNCVHPFYPSHWLDLSMDLKITQCIFATSFSVQILNYAFFSARMNGSLWRGVRSDNTVWKVQSTFSITKAFSFCAFIHQEYDMKIDLFVSLKMQDSLNCSNFSLPPLVMSELFQTIRCTDRWKGWTIKVRIVPYIRWYTWYGEACFQTKG